LRKGACPLRVWNGIFATGDWRIKRGLKVMNGRRISVPAHFPEIGFEPGRLLEDHDQLCFAGRCGVEIGKTFEVRPRFRRDLLVWCTGVLDDPNAIGIRCSVRIGSRGEPRRDLCVADHAGGKRHLECKQITTHSRIEHVACIGQRLDRRRGLFKIAGRQAPAGTDLHMQVHLDVENGREAGSRFAHVSQLWRLIDGERVGASKLDEEQVVLNKVVTKRRFGE